MLQSDPRVLELQRQQAASVEILPASVGIAAAAGRETTRECWDRSGSRRVLKSDPRVLESQRQQAASVEIRPASVGIAAAAGREC